MRRSIVVMLVLALLALAAAAGPLTAPSASPQHKTAGWTWVGWKWK